MTQSARNTKRIHTLVIGAGQAGLATGYHLSRRGIPFQIVDANPRIGDAWRNRWDSLRLFTVARYCGLPGLPFPGPSDVTPTKDEMANYLESYAHFHKLPVQTSVKIDRLYKEDGRFIAQAADQQFEAEHVVVAMANYQVPKIPAFAAQLDPCITQLHAHKYRNPSQLQDGPVLIVGVGNSGADIAMEVSRTHSTFLAGKESGHIPFHIDTAVSRHVISHIFRFVFHHVLSVATPIGRKVRPKMLDRAAPLVRVKPQDLVNAGIKRVDRMAGVQLGLPRLAGGKILYVKNVIWCTGYEPGFSWIDLPIFGKDGRPTHERGVSVEPGLYFVGLDFLYSMSSATLMGVSRDAERIAKAVKSKTLTNWQELGSQLQTVPA